MGISSVDESPGSGANSAQDQQELPFRGIAPMDPLEFPELTQFLDQLDQPGLLFFPVRHHSPACAWHLQRWIRTHRPAAVLIEGPANATALIPLMLDPQTQPPIALYTTFVDQERRLGTPADQEPLRFAGYYPFCDYSPEWVAIQTGREVGSHLEFIDLPYAEQVLASHAETSQPSIRALQEEHYLKRSAFLAALAHKTGCRDHDELWDHLFEIQATRLPTSTFIRQVATYCWLARLDASPEALAADGTLAREQAMMTAIHSVRQRIPGTLLIVTGGFHTVVLPQQAGLQGDQETQGASPSPDREGLAVLMRYSFEQLDALNGYAAGMPAPDYYQRVWHYLQQAETPSRSRTHSSSISPDPISDPVSTDSFSSPESFSSPDSAYTQDPFDHAACDLLIELGRFSRHQNRLPPLSVADEIAAYEQVRRLASFRGHPAPARQDLLDAITSCFVKGSMDAEGALLMTAVRHLMCGQRIGSLPVHAGVPPLVTDFRQVAASLGLKLDTTVPKGLILELYRKKPHRRLSRFLHSLIFLEVPFAHLTAGPDFVRGQGLERLQEHWSYRWIPQTESALIERSLYGSTLQEATLARLKEQISALADSGEARSALRAVQLLVSACRMGLQEQVPTLVQWLQESLSSDPSFPQLGQATTQLSLLWQSREPLEAHGVKEMPLLLQTAYRRLCFLTPPLAHCPESETSETLGAFTAIWEMVHQFHQGNQSSQELQPGLERFSLDRQLWVEALLSLFNTPEANPALLGGSAGILHSLGTVSTSDLVSLVAGHLDHASVDPAAGVGFLRGLLKTSREVAWSIPDLLGAIHVRLQQWDSEAFLRTLPELRLAFAELIPRETDQVAAVVAGLLGTSTLGRLLHSHSTEADLQIGLQMNQWIDRSLLADDLQHWLISELPDFRIG